MKAITLLKNHAFFSQEKIFMFSMLLVNGGNYLYNLILGRVLGPSAFSETALLVTFLLILSFIGMTFQVVTTKFYVITPADNQPELIKLISKYALITGVIIGVFLIGFQTSLQSFFKISFDYMFVILGIAVPFYFLMSVNRGVHQGKSDLFNLANTYQTEMLGRFIFTFLVLWLFPSNPTLAVSVGIGLSFIFGLFPNQVKSVFAFKSDQKISLLQNKQLLKFFAFTAFYECTLILINNSDILMVKHFFDDIQAGLYASIALIGRMVYFLTWIAVMILLPKVIALHHQGLETKNVLLTNMFYILVLASSIVLVTYLFPNQAIMLMFGEQYLPVADLLWKYALATSLFALSNIIAYYYLSINIYFPILLSAIFGFLQIYLVAMYHTSLNTVVEMQIAAMAFLFIAQLLFFLYQQNKTVRRM